MAEQDWREAAAEVWQLFKKTNAELKELQDKFRETEAELKELKDKVQKIDIKLRENDTQLKQTDKWTNELPLPFTSKWEMMIEALRQPTAMNLFREWGIDAYFVSHGVMAQKNDQTMKLDLLLRNDRQVVVAQVRTTLHLYDVQ